MNQTRIVDLRIRAEGGGGGLTAMEALAIAQEASGIAAAGQVVEVGESVFSSDTKQRFTNNSPAAVTLTGIDEADLLMTVLEPDAPPITDDPDFYDREITASGAVMADESVLVTTAGLALAFPATGVAGDEIIVGNGSGGMISLTGMFDGETDGAIETDGVIAFRWNEDANEWRGYVFGGSGGSAATPPSTQLPVT